MPQLKTQPLNYRLQAPSFYQPDPEGSNFAPEDTQPFDVAIFNETLAANDSDESRYIIPREVWLESVVASASQGSGANPGFAFTIQQVITDPSGNEIVVIAQDKAVNSPVKFGTAQQPAVHRKMQYFAPGVELVCQVTNLQNASNAIQVVLRFYVRNLPTS
jgi:hypothetical protein